jgi:hypothetical protein
MFLGSMMAPLAVSLVGCQTLKDNTFKFDDAIVSVNGPISESRVKAWMQEVKNRSGVRYGSTRITVNAQKTQKTAWSPTFGRPVAIFDDGACGWTSGSKKSCLVRVAITQDGYFPDAYGIHEMAHALQFTRIGTSTLDPAWKGWILGWHA